MERYFVNGCVIIKLNEQLKSEYQAKYIITYNHDIIDFANTKEEAMKIANSFKK